MATKIEKNDNKKTQKSGLNMIVLAAGMGTRMKSSLPKVLHKVGGLSMIEHIFRTLSSFDDNKNIIVVSSNDILETLKEKLSSYNDVHFAVQENRDGTGDAVKSAIKSNVWKKLENKYSLTGVCFGDVPFIKKESIKKMISLQSKYDLVILGFTPKNQSIPYGRLILKGLMPNTGIGKSCRLDSIKEFIEFQKDEKIPTLCNSGIMIGKTEIFEKYIDKIKNDNKKGEYYLTDIVKLAGKKYNIGTYICDEGETIGVNSKLDLAHAETYFQNSMRTKFMENGTTMIDPHSVYFSYDTKIGKDVIIEPNVFFGKGVKIGDNCYIRVGCYLEDVEIKGDTKVGPYCRTRGGVIMEKGAYVGNFAEVKGSKIGSGTKIGHFSYTGDTTIGSDCNIGAGMVVCNYNGAEKFKTKIGNNVFVGSNSTIVAPCEIEDKSFIGGGSVITKKVEKYSLALGRERQTNIENWGLVKGLWQDDSVVDKKLKKTGKQHAKKIIADKAKEDNKKIKK